MNKAMNVLDVIIKDWHGMCCDSSLILLTTMPIRKGNEVGMENIVTVFPIDGEMASLVGSVALRNASRVITCARI